MVYTHLKCSEVPSLSAFCRVDHIDFDSRRIHQPRIHRTDMLEYYKERVEDVNPVH